MGSRYDQYCDLNRALFPRGQCDLICPQKATGLQEVANPSPTCARGGAPSSPISSLPVPAASTWAHHFAGASLPRYAAVVPAKIGDFRSFQAASAQPNAWTTVVASAIRGPRVAAFADRSLRCWDVSNRFVEAVMAGLTARAGMHVRHESGSSCGHAKTQFATAAPAFPAGAFTSAT